MISSLSNPSDAVMQLSKRKERTLKIPRDNVTREPSPTSANLTVCVQKLESQTATLVSDNGALVFRNEALASENATLITQNTEKDANITARKAAHAALSRENSNLSKDKLKIHGLLKVMTESHATITRSHSHRVAEKDVLVKNEVGLLARIAELEEYDLLSDSLRAEIMQRGSKALKKAEQAGSERAQLEQENSNWQQEKQTQSQEKGQWMEKYEDLRRINESLRRENEGLRRNNTQAREFRSSSR